MPIFTTKNDTRRGVADVSTGPKMEYDSLISAAKLVRTEQPDFLSIGMNESASNILERAAQLAVKEKLCTDMVSKPAIESYKAAERAADVAFELGSIKTAQRLYTRTLTISLTYHLGDDFSHRADASMLKVALELKRLQKNPIEQQLRTESA